MQAGREFLPVEGRLAPLRQVGQHRPGHLQDDVAGRPDLRDSDRRARIDLDLVAPARGGQRQAGAAHLDPEGVAADAALPAGPVAPCPRLAGDAGVELLVDLAAREAPDARPAGRDQRQQGEGRVKPEAAVPARGSGVRHARALHCENLGGLIATGAATRQRRRRWSAGGWREPLWRGKRAKL